jgi:hypothetical protein
MAKANKTSFQKGQVPNPKGRPRGSISEHRKKFAEIAKLAANDAKDIYNELRECMKAGESWAYQLYVKDLIPKKSFEPTVLVKMEEGQPRLEALTTAMYGFTELTHPEALEEIKVLKGIEEKEEQKDRGIMLLNLLPVEQLKQIDDWVEAAKKENEKI